MTDPNKKYKQKLDDDFASDAHILNLFCTSSNTLWQTWQKVFGKTQRRHRSNIVNQYYRKILIWMTTTVVVHLTCRSQSSDLQSGRRRPDP